MIWFLGKYDMDKTPDVRTVAEAARDRWHDEQMRMRCLELGLSDDGSYAAAHDLYRKVTGRDWPVWGAPEAAVIYAGPDPERRVPRYYTEEDPLEQDDGA